MKNISNPYWSHDPQDASLGSLPTFSCLYIDVYINELLCVRLYFEEHVPKQPFIQHIHIKSRVLIPGVTGQIPELLRIAVKLHRHHYL